MRTDDYSALVARHRNYFRSGITRGVGPERDRADPRLDKLRRCDRERLHPGWASITASGDSAHTGMHAAFSTTALSSISGFATRRTTETKLCGKLRITCWREHRSA